MKYYRIFTFFPFLFLLFSMFAQEPLPKGLTEGEKEVYEEYIRTFEYGRSTQPPEVPPRTPAQFEETGGVIVTWAAYYDELREIVRHSRKRVPVYIITNNPGWVQNYLQQGGVPLDNIEFVTIPYNSVWVRDYGPQSVYLDDDDQLAFIDWVYNRPHRPDDNLVPYNMADYLDLPIYQMTVEPNRLVHTGGNLMVDGHGKAFSSKLVLTENPAKTVEEIDEIMYDYMGIETYIKMDELPFDNISHLDMHMKLLDEETLLVGEFPEGVSDGPYIEANLQYLLENYETAYGRDFNVVRIPMVPNHHGQYPPYSSYRTYTNSLIVNDLMLVPQYWDPDLNKEAIAILKEAMPGYEIVGINMEGVIGASGAIHCISREIAAEDPVFISHASIREAYCGEPVDIEAEIHNEAGITEASVYWSNDGGENYQQEVMTYEDGVYFAEIPEQACQAEIKYYISSTNNNGKTINKPLVAPDGTYTFDLTCKIDFTVGNDHVMVLEPVEYTYTGCLEEYEEVHWDFGDGANPDFATTIGPHEVYYETEGYKTVILTVDEQSLTKEDIVYVYASYELVIEKEGEGQTDPEPGAYTYAEGDEVELDAWPDEGWKFVDWTDADGNVVSELPDFVFTMPAEDVILTASFDPEEYELTVEVSPENSGSVIIEPELDFYNFGDEISLTAVAEEYYEFVNWIDDDGNVLSDEESFVFVMPAADAKVIAVFQEVVTYELTVQKEGEGQTDPEPGTYQHVEGAEVELVALPDDGWKFKEWDVEGAEPENDDNKITILIYNDVVATAIFEKETHVPSLKTKFTFDVYPNPSGGLFNIVMSPADGPINIIVSDMQGRLIYKNTIVNMQQDYKYKINVEGQPPGVYLVRITWQNNSEVERIIIR